MPLAGRPPAFTDESGGSFPAAAPLALHRKGPKIRRINPYPEVNHVNASKITLVGAPALRVGVVVAAALLAARLQADSYAAALPLPMGGASSYSVSDPRPTVEGVTRAGREPEPVPASRVEEEAKVRKDTKVRNEPRPVGRASGRQFAFFCFGPTFGNASRGVDPNFMPPPSVSDNQQQTSAAPARVLYTRTPATTPGKMTWVGTDGSMISYSLKFPRSDNRSLANSATSENLSVADLIAENRSEMTKISWIRAYRRFPELEAEDSPERAAFESYVAERRADPGEASFFERPMWPEEISAAFMTEWNWRKAEAESWDRVRAKVRIFNDPDSVYTRRFWSFTEELRIDSQTAPIFDDSAWPEKALELHDRKLGPVPQQFR